MENGKDINKKRSRNPLQKASGTMECRIKIDSLK